VSLGAIIEQKETGKILLVKRADDYDFRPGEWEFMSGRMNQYEEPEDALRREVKEETGLDVEITKLIGHKEILNTPENYHRVVFFHLARPQQRIPAAHLH